jgi:SAM-dependent methyltransferase
LCGESAVEALPGYESFHGVTSDCKPWRKGGRLGVCPACGGVQKVIDSAWQSDTDKIYRDYTIYHQSAGAEQPVFDVVSGAPSARSERLLKCLASHTPWPETGRLLDIGWGNGALLRAFGRIAPRWSLARTELDDKSRSVVEGIDHVEAFFTIPPAQIPGTYDLITMIHVLEHIITPKRLLNSLRNKLTDGGLLVVEVPEFLQNPFDLLITDHCTHFSAATVIELLRSTGYEVVLTATDWVPKELTIVALKAKGQYRGRTDTAFSSFESAMKCLQWLKSVVETARATAKNGEFGLFGTAIGATWLFQELRESVRFFVDEDVQRAGKNHMGIPIYLPQNVPNGSHVYLALTPGIAKSI